MWECHQCVSKEEVLSTVTVHVDLLRHCLLLVVKSTLLRQSSNSDQVEGDSGVCVYFRFKRTEVSFGV